MLSIGIVGLPNVGKSTLFKALTKKQVDIANFPFCTIDPNVGVVEVPDQRLWQLAEASKSEKTIPAAIQFIDIAGLVEGASKGEGLGNQFLSNIRESDAILHVVRVFEDEKIIHVGHAPEPKKDIEIISYELIFKDLETLSKHTPKVEKEVKAGKKEASIEIEMLKKLTALLEKGEPAKDLKLKENEIPFFKNLNLLSAKPVLYLLNCSSDKRILENPREIQPTLEVDVKLENELSELNQGEAEEMKKALPHPKNSLDDLISACYALLKLETFFTTGQDETRAWTVEKGTKAPQAAGKIHSDFEKGFIRADVIFWEDLLKNGSWNRAKELGILKTEGKEYVVKDGDVMIFKFN